MTKIDTEFKSCFLCNPLNRNYISMHLCIECSELDFREKKLQILLKKNKILNEN
jgi:hypothetical protein